MHIDRYKDKHKVYLAYMAFSSLRAIVSWNVAVFALWMQGDIQYATDVHVVTWVMPEEMKGDFSQSSPQSAKSLQSMPDPISYRVCRSRKRASEARWRGLRYGYEMNKLIGGRKRAGSCADKKIK